MNALTGQIALVTGASRGIGRAIARRLAEEGAEVGITARTQSDLDALKTEIEDMSRRCVVFVADLREPDQIAALAQQALEQMRRVDILVNNAGVGTWGPAGSITLDQYNDMFDLNMRAVFLLTQALAPQMIARGSGHILNIASTSGRWTYPHGTVYCASKFAVLGFTEALAKELRETGVRVTAICPGQVNTYLGGGGPQSWVDGMLSGEDVAALAVQVLTLPPHAIVTEMVIWPRAEKF